MKIVVREVRRRALISPQRFSKKSNGIFCMNMMRNMKMELK